MSLEEKLTDPALDPQETDHIVGDFVRQYGKAELRARYEDKYRKLTERPALEVVPSHRRVPPGVWRWVAGVAACGLALLLLTDPFGWRGQGRQELLTEYLNVEDHYVPTSRTSDGSLTNTDLFADFRARRYAAVVARANQPLSEAETYYLALSYLALRDYEAAERAFRGGAAGAEYRLDAEWYLTLLQYRRGETERALNRLRTYTPDDGIHYQQARRLLEAGE